MATYITQITLHMHAQLRHFLPFNKVQYPSPALQGSACSAQLCTGRKGSRIMRYILYSLWYIQFYMLMQNPFFAVKKNNNVFLCDSSSISLYISNKLMFHFILPDALFSKSSDHKLLSRSARLCCCCSMNIEAGACADLTCWFSSSSSFLGGISPLLELLPGPVLIWCCCLCLFKASRVMIICAGESAPAPAATSSSFPLPPVATANAAPLAGANLDENNISTPAVITTQPTDPFPRCLMLLQRRVKYFFQLNQFNTPKSSLPRQWVQGIISISLEFIFPQILRKKICANMLNYYSPWKKSPGLNKSLFRILPYYQTDISSSNAKEQNCKKPFFIIYPYLLWSLTQTMGYYDLSKGKTVEYWRLQLRNSTQPETKIASVVRGISPISTCWLAYMKSLLFLAGVILLANKNVDWLLVVTWAIGIEFFPD